MRHHPEANHIPPISWTKRSFQDLKRFCAVCILNFDDNPHPWHHIDHYSTFSLLLLKLGKTSAFLVVAACWHLHTAVLSLLVPGHWTFYDPICDDNNNASNEYPCSKVGLQGPVAFSCLALITNSNLGPFRVLKSDILRNRNLLHGYRGKTGVVASTRA